MGSRYNHGYVLYKKYRIDEVLRIIDEQDDIPDSILYGKYDYKDSKARTKIIKAIIERDGGSCMICGEKAEYFACGKDNGGRWHLDLYSDKDGVPYMYTIDHIHPKSKGGGNTLDNYQLLCKVCNEKKSDTVDGELYTSKEVASITTFNYIGRKLSSLEKQTKGILTKIKGRTVVCVKKKKGFTIGNEYPVLNIRARIDSDFNSKYSFRTINDAGEETTTNFKYFLTKMDAERNRYDRYDTSKKINKA